MRRFILRKPTVALTDRLVLHLILKTKWYLMQEEGTKTEEYREMTKYWYNRILTKRYTHVCFHKGYSNTTFTRKIDCIESGYGRPDWGAPLDRPVIIIKHSSKP